MQHHYHAHHCCTHRCFHHTNTWADGKREPSGCQASIFRIHTDIASGLSRRSTYDNMGLHDEAVADYARALELDNSGPGAGDGACN